MVYALVLARGSVTAIDNPARQAFVMEMVGPERVVNAVALNSVLVHSARIVGPAAAGGADRAVRRVGLLRGERGDVPRDGHRAAADGPGAAPARGARAAFPRPAARGALVRAPDAEPAHPAGDDGRRRDRLVQLPGAAAAARRGDLARHRRDLRAADRGDGSRLGAGRARRGRAREGDAASCWSAPRRCSAAPSSWWRLRLRSSCRHSLWSRWARRASRSRRA